MVRPQRCAEEAPRRTTLAWGLLVLIGLLVAVAARQPRVAAWPADDPPFPAEPPQELKDLLNRPLNEDGFDDQNSEDGNRPFFDDFSWRAFIALNWPAKPPGRGNADDSKSFGDTSADRTVWETWKSAEEVVPPDGQPTPWDDFSLQRSFTRALGPDAGRVKIFTKAQTFQDIFQAGFAALGPKIEGPLIDQKGNYVRFELHVNQTEYNEIFTKHYYQKDALDQAAAQAPGGKIEFPVGALEVKAAWRLLPDEPAVLDHFYWRDAFVVNWDNNGKPILMPTKVGLVGFHIVAKTKQRPNWIWATFEHEDNVVTSPGGIEPPSFCNKTQGIPWAEPGPQAPADWQNKVQIGKPLPSLSAVEVSRKHDLSAFPATLKINQRYRGHPQVQNTVWKHYQLIRTQWPILTTGKPAPSKDVANVTMETYRQKITCMACHDTAAKCRFVYFLELRADPSTHKNLADAMQRLQKAP